jgi:hypothetical protein
MRGRSLRFLSGPLLLFSLALSASPAGARVFSYKDSALAAYVRGTGGFSQLTQDAFANESGAGTSVNGSSKYNYGAEVGFAMNLEANTHLRIGAELIRQMPVNGEGSDSSGTSRYTLNSTVFVFNPNIAIEHVYSVKGILRYYLAVGVGYANVTVVNDYKMTAAGTSALGVSDFKETMEANVLSSQASVGLETLFTDNVTFMADFGYRYLPVKGLKYKNEMTNFTGAVHKGDDVLNADGSKRNLNLGGLFGGVSFRFYLNFL